MVFKERAVFHPNAAINPRELDSWQGSFSSQLCFSSGSVYPNLRSLPIPSCQCLPLLTWITVILHSVWHLLIAVCLSVQCCLLAGWNTSLPPCAMAVENHTCENLPKHCQSAILSSSKNPKNDLAEVFCSIFALQVHLADVDWCSSSQLKGQYVLQSVCALWHTMSSKMSLKITCIL